jgi:hypothetical protein
LAINPQDPKTVYAGTWGRGVFKSIDGGASWDVVNSGLPTDPRFIESLAIDPQNPSTVYAVIGQLGTPASNGRAGVFKSMDAGASWGDVNSGMGAGYPSIRILAISRQDPSTLYVSTSGGGTFAITFVP